MTTKHALCRQLLPGESISFDGGRLVITVQEKTGRRARLTFSMRQDVVIDRPGKEGAANTDPPCKVKTAG